MTRTTGTIAGRFFSDLKNQTDINSRGSFHYYVELEREQYKKDIRKMLTWSEVFQLKQSA